MVKVRSCNFTFDPHFTCFIPGHVYPKSIDHLSGHQRETTGLSEGKVTDGERHEGSECTDTTHPNYPLHLPHSIYPLYSNRASFYAKLPILPILTWPRAGSFRGLEMGDRRHLINKHCWLTVWENFVIRKEE